MSSKRFAIITASSIGAALSIAFILFHAEVMGALGWLWQLYEGREAARDLFMRLGHWGPLVFIGLQIFQIVFFPIPGEATELLGGFLFGKWLGLLYSMTGLTLGSLSAFFIARYFRGLAKRILVNNPWYQKLNRIVEHQGLFVCFLLFLFPGFPKDFLCYFLGLTSMPWTAFAIISFMGRMPGAFMLNLQGASVYEGNKWEIIAVFSIILFITLPTWIKREKIYQWIEDRTRGGN